MTGSETPAPPRQLIEIFDEENLVLTLLCEASRRGDEAEVRRLRLRALELFAEGCLAAATVGTFDGETAARDRFTGGPNGGERLH